MSFGLNEKGFKRKRYADIREDLASRWKEKFGEDSRTDERSVNGILISLIAYAASPIWMLAEKVYNSGFVHKAEGQALSGIVGNNLLKRRPAEKAKGTITIIGDEGTVVDAGFKASYKTSYSTIEEVKIGSSGEVEVEVKADATGVIGNVESEKITEIDTPIVGVSEVVNRKPVSGGREEETDDELKQRYDLSLSTGGSPSTNGIRAEVLGVEGVRTATVIENLTGEEDSEGRPPKSYETYVLGGEDVDVAKAIFKRRAAGTRPYGNTIIEVEDDSGNIVPIGFSRANEVEIYFDIKLDTNNKFPRNGVRRIKTLIIEHIGGLDFDGNEYTGLQTGDDVYFTKIISLIHSLPGVEYVKDLQIGTDENNLGSFKNVSIERTKVAMTDYEKIDVT